MVCHRCVPLSRLSSNTTHHYIFRYSTFVFRFKSAVHGSKAEIRVSVAYWGEGMSDGINDIDEEEDGGDYYDLSGVPEGSRAAEGIYTPDSNDNWNHYTNGYTISREGHGQLIVKDASAVRVLVSTELILDSDTLEDYRGGWARYKKRPSAGQEEGSTSKKPRLDETH